jgi:hypothetical protein
VKWISHPKTAETRMDKGFPGFSMFEALNVIYWVVFVRGRAA